jgi:hypothetical protein
MFLCVCVCVLEGRATGRGMAGGCRYFRGSRRYWADEGRVSSACKRRSRCAQLNSMDVNALRLSHEFADMVREEYSQDSFHGDEGEWTKAG